MSKISIYVLSLNYGGAERAITNIANILSINNDVTINSIYKIGNKPFYELNNNIEVKYLTELSPNREAFKNAIKSINIIKILKEGFRAVRVLYLKKKVIINAIKNDTSDIIITTRKDHNFYLGKYAKKNVIKIGQEHNDFSSIKEINKVIKGARNLDYFMPVSKFLADKYSKLLNNFSVNVKYIPHSIKEYNIQNVKKENQIICVGRLEKIKAIDDTIRVFSSLKNKVVKLVIVGSGSEEDYLKSLVKDYHLDDRVIFKGKMNYGDLYKEYEKSLLLVSTSLSESFGLVIIEAANAGILSVVFDSAQGFKETIKNGENGFIIEKRSKEEMVNIIDNLLEDNDLLNKLSKNAKESSKPYYEDNISKMWNEFIKKLAKH